MIYLFIGMSCAGKDTLCKEFLKKHKDTVLPIISYTTRPMRENEVDGVEYNFVSEEHFKELIKNDQLTEYRIYNVKVNGNDDTWYYGTPKFDFDLSTYDYVGVVEIKVAKKIVETYGSDNVDITYVIADDAEREKRANLRGSFDKTEWDRRFQTDKEDFSDKKLNDLEAMLNGKPMHLYYN